MGASAESEKADREIKLSTNLLDDLPCIVMIIEKRTHEIVASNKRAIEVGAVPGKECYRTFAGRGDRCPFCKVPLLAELKETQSLEFEYNGKWFRAMWVDYSEELYVHYIFDITEAKKTEDQLKEKKEDYKCLFEMAPDPIFTLNKKGVITSANNAAFRIMGYSKDNVVGKHIKELENINKIEVQKFLKVFNSVLGGKAAKPFEIIWQSKDGKQKFSEIHLSLMGERGVQAVARDVTERKKAEIALVRAFDDLALANEKLGVVGKLTRHDVRNKLFVVNNNIYLAKKRVPPDNESLKYLNQTESTIAQIERIFEFAQMYEQLGMEDLSEVDVGKSFQLAIDNTTDLQNITIVNECSGLKVIADSMLSRLFYNLIDNSLKYGKNVSKIRIHFKDGVDSLKLFYEDNGIGIPKAEKEKIFRERYGKGTGLGLYMIKKMCDIYGWNIQETDRHGEGAQFTMRIPKIIRNNN